MLIMYGQWFILAESLALFLIGHPNTFIRHIIRIKMIVNVHDYSP
jgi:hypothetical protein